MLWWQAVCVAVAVCWSVAHGAEPSFLAPSSIDVGDTAFGSPTSIALGPDGRLYCTTIDGYIFALVVVRTAAGKYTVVSYERIDVLRTDLPNHNDDGSPAPDVIGRLVAGLLVDGTAAVPVLWVASCDPRYPLVPPPAGTATPPPGMDLNSCVLSRVTKRGAAMGGGWEHTQVVRGLPRSAENHLVEGIARLNATTLLITIGGTTNLGAPSHNFFNVPETPFTAAMFALNLDRVAALEAASALPHDLPTAAPHLSPPGAPFGSHSFRNAAVWRADGPLQLYASGLRNAYDVAVSPGGLVFTVDNDPNAGWGGLPVGCSNAVSEDSSSPAAAARIAAGNILFHITHEGYYGGHPNPSRGDPHAAGFVNASRPLTDIVPFANPVECAPDPAELAGDPIPGRMGAAQFSTTGIALYSTPNFDGAMDGNILAASSAGVILRGEWTLVDGVAELTAPLSSLLTAGPYPIDVVTGPPTSAFAGVIIVADLISGITFYEPADFNGTVPAGCSGIVGVHLDDDADGYSNADEVASGSNPCSAASTPPDHDGDLLGDLFDDDDDDDGITDANDVFAFDALNGRTRTAHGQVVASAGPLTSRSDGSIALDFATASGSSLGASLFSMGFTGLMRDTGDPPGPHTSYGPGRTPPFADVASYFSPTNIVSGGAASVFTIQAVGPGSASDDSSPTGRAQRAAFGFGFEIGITPVELTFVLSNPFPASGPTPVPGQAAGFFVGDGSQQTWMALVCVADTGGGVAGVEFVVKDALTHEWINEAFVPVPGTVPDALRVAAVADPALAAASAVELGMIIDVVSAVVVEPWYSLDGGATRVSLGRHTAPLNIARLYTPLMAGIMATTSGVGAVVTPPAPPFPATWVSCALSRLAWDPWPATGLSPTSAPLSSATARFTPLELPDAFPHVSTFAGGLHIENTGATDIVAVVFHLPGAINSLSFDPGSLATTGSPPHIADSTSPGVAVTGWSPLGTVVGMTAYGVNVSFAGFTPGTAINLGFDLDVLWINTPFAFGEPAAIDGTHLLGASLELLFALPGAAAPLAARTVVSPPLVRLPHHSWESGARVTAAPWPAGLVRPRIDSASTPAGALRLEPTLNGAGTEVVGPTNITVTVDGGPVLAGSAVRATIVIAMRAHALESSSNIPELNAWEMTDVIGAGATLTAVADADGRAVIATSLDAWWAHERNAELIDHFSHGPAYAVLVACFDIPGVVGAEAICSEYFTVHILPPPTLTLAAFGGSLPSVQPWTFPAALELTVPPGAAAADRTIVYPQYSPTRRLHNGLYSGPTELQPRSNGAGDHRGPRLSPPSSHALDSRTYSLALTGAAPTDMLILDFGTSATQSAQVGGFGPDATPYFEAATLAGAAGNVTLSNVHLDLGGWGNVVAEDSLVFGGPVTVSTVLFGTALASTRVAESVGGVLQARVPSWGRVGGRVQVVGAARITSLELAISTSDAGILTRLSDNLDEVFVPVVVGPAPFDMSDATAVILGADAAIAASFAQTGRLLSMTARVACASVTHAPPPPFAPPTPQPWWAWECGVAIAVNATSAAVPPPPAPVSSPPGFVLGFPPSPPSELPIPPYAIASIAVVAAVAALAVLAYILRVVEVRRQELAAVEAAPIEW